MIPPKGRGEKGEDPGQSIKEYNRTGCEGKRMPHKGGQFERDTDGPIWESSAWAEKAGELRSDQLLLIARITPAVFSGCAHLILAGWLNPRAGATSSFATMVGRQIIQRRAAICDL